MKQARARKVRTKSPSWFETLRATFGINEPKSLRETLELTLKQGPETASEFSSQERDMLLRILRFGGLRVEDVMVPRADIVAIDESVATSELLRLFKRCRPFPHPSVQ